MIWVMFLFEPLCYEESQNLSAQCIMETDKDLCCGINEAERILAEKVQVGLDDLAVHGKRCRYRKGQVLFYGGHLPCGMYILTRGSVVLSRTALQGEESKRITNSKHPLGLLHLIAGTPFCTTATAGGQTEVLFISKAKFLNFVRTL